VLNETEYILTYLTEECAEIIKAANKAIRFGLKDYSLNDKEKGTNLEALVEEINDLMGVLKKMSMMKIFTLEEVQDQEKMYLKVGKIEWFMDYSRNRGCLEKK
jgi:NTP pyrophosphatase (non-canonical NTP hydrolase)